jgi:hypothetical protein
MAGGASFEYDTVAVFTLVEEGGELKVAHVKDFCDPEKRDKYCGWAAKTLAEGMPVA